jgi:membrane protein
VSDPGDPAGRITTVFLRAKKRLPGLPAPLLRALVTIREVVVETFRGFRADRGADLAGSLAFTTLLAAVPLLATFSLLIAAFFKEKDTQVLEFVNRILPYHTAQITQTLRDFVAESTALSGIGLVVLIVASVRLIFIIEANFNAVWGAPSRRDWIRRIAIYTFVLFALALLLGALTAGFERLSAATGTVLFPFLVEFGALLLLYRFLPNAYVRWTSSAVAAGVVAGGLEVLRFLFGLYVRTLSGMNLITGSLSFLMLTLISIFFVWILILLGVELTHVLQTKISRHRRPGGSKAGRAENAIRMLLTLARGGFHSFRDLYSGQESSSVEAEKILGCLLEGGLVQGDPARGYVLALPPDEITVARVVESVSPNLYTITPEEDDRVVHVLQPLFERLESERRALLGTTLADLRER